LFLADISTSQEGHQQSTRAKQRITCDCDLDSRRAPSYSAILVHLPHHLFILPDHKNGWSIAMARCKDIFFASGIEDSTGITRELEGSCHLGCDLSFISSVHGLSPSSIQHISLPDHKYHLSNAMIMSQDAYLARSDLPFGHAAGVLESHLSSLCCCHYSDSGRPCTTPWSHPPLQRDCRSCISCPDLQRQL